MPKPFRQLTLLQFDTLLVEFVASGGRRVNAVHVHHTWRPNHSQYRGQASIDAMWRYHTQDNGWNDIAQHLTIAPDGVLWTGRNWNATPASASGHNGNGVAGPFMFEMIGDFDVGRDELAGAQLHAAIHVTARVLAAFRLGADAIRFHSEMSTKTCPGSGVSQRKFVEEVGAAMRATPWPPTGTRAWSSRASERSPEDDAFLDLVRATARAGTAEPGDAEHAEQEMTEAQVGRLTRPEEGSRDAARARAGGGTDGAAFTPGELAALRPHVVNMRAGRLSTSGWFTTSEADLAHLFAYHLKRELDAAKGNPNPDERKLRIVLWAHGGLNDEETGLRIALRQVAWWKKNNVWPIFFVWETGFWDALEQLIRGDRPRAARDLADWTSDPALEVIARVGTKIWTAMKVSAERASSGPSGAAHLFAQGLRKFVADHPDGVEIHAVGHSAGSIFHAHLLPVLTGMGGPKVRSLQLLAPAIRIDEFHKHLAPLVGGSIESLRMFTMLQDWERADSVGPYRKSLLYLVSRALEGWGTEPILGLEESLRADAAAAALFGLGTPPAKGDVVWSVTDGDSGPVASRSTSHGGFDNDPPTMNSVCHMIRGLPPIEGYREDDQARGIGSLFSLKPQSYGAFQPTPLTLQSPAALPPAPAGPLPGPTSGGGRRIALCVGINDYASAPLSGCVPDAQAWASTLSRLGFEVSMLLDGQATRQAILDRLGALVRDGQPGDVVVFQFAGHGTEVPDEDGDEKGGSNGAKDEALCPYDFDRGALLIDDDLADVFVGIRDGVNFTCFFDCCHSGTAARLAGPRSARPAGNDVRARFLVATPELQEKHKHFRTRAGGTRAASRAPQEYGKEILFAACQPEEVAYEVGGQGQFTFHCMPILAAGLAGLSHQEFQHRVERGFGSAARQRPKLSADPALFSLGLLMPFGVTSSGAASRAATVSGEPSATRALAQAVESLAAALRR